MTGFSWAEALDKVREGFGAAEVRVDRLEEQGDTIAVAITMRVRAPKSGIETDVPQSHLFTFRDGKVVRYEWSSDADRAFEALRGPLGA